MRKLLSTVAAVAVAGGLAYTIARTSQLPLLTGPGCAEAGAQLQCLNQVIQGVNSGVTGNYAYQGGPIGNSGSGTTTANITFASAAIPTGTALLANQGYRARCAGISTIATAFKIGITVGRSMAASLESSTGSPEANTPNWDVELQWQTSINQTTATPNYSWMARAFSGAPTGTVTGGQLAINSGNDTTVTDNSVSFGVPITCVMYGGAVTGEVTMMNFSVEQLR